MRKSPQLNTPAQRRRLLRLWLRSLWVLLPATALGAGLALTTVGFAGASAPKEKRSRALNIAITLDIANESGHVKRRPNFGCLPQGVQLKDVVKYGGSRNGEVTVEQTLNKMKAQCRKGKLVDAKGREIRFFRPSCWGNAPSDYLEIQKRENAELEKLKRRYTVIVFSCNPMIQ